MLFLTYFKGSFNMERKFVKSGMMKQKNYHVRTFTPR